MHINEIISIEDVEERSAAARKYFSPFTDVVDITGSEDVAATVLVNLSQKKGEVKDLICTKSARRCLKDNKHVECCLKEVAWQHTHNLKYPDARVSAQRILVSSPPSYLGYISSNGLAEELGWSHNSSEYNRAKLFCSAFVWRDRVCNLSTVLKEGHAIWKNTIMSLGMTSRGVDDWIKKITICNNSSYLPDEVNQYSPQVRFSYRSCYISITPVVSHAVITNIQRLARKGEARFARILLPRPSSIGDLAGSVGGNINVLHYPPRLIRSIEHSFPMSGVDFIKEGKSLFKKGALYHSDFVSSCETLVNAKLISTSKVRKVEKRCAIYQVMSSLMEWLAPIYEWRESMEEVSEKLLGLDESLEWRVASQFGLLSPKLLREVNQKLNDQLGKVYKTRHLAYHPELMRSLKAILRSLLGKYSIKNISSSQAASAEDGQDAFVYLKKMRVYDASAMSTPYLCGIPSLTALWGMIKEYEIKLKKLLNIDIAFDGVGWFLREYREWGDTKLPAKVKLKSKEVLRPGLLPSRYCDLTMDVVIRVHDPEAKLSSVDPQLLQAVCPSRFAGGTLHPPGLEDERHWCRVESYTSVFRELQRLPRSGRWIVPETTSHDGLKENLFLFNKFNNIKPVMAGYALLEEPVEKPGSLEALHAYAESLIGIARLASPVEFRFRGWRALAQEGFWGMRSDNRAMLMTRV